MTTKRKPKAKRKTKPYEWTNRDQLRAEKEGWAIFEAHGGQEIEADQDSSRFTRKGVYDDDAAIAHVCRRALAGSRLHVRALVIHLRDVIDIFKVAHGYDVDDQIPQKLDEPGRRYARYSHQFSVAYTINSNHPTGDDLTAWAHREAIILRARELTEVLSAEEATKEAVENMDNTIENECLSADGWPPEPEESDDPATTG